MTKTEIQHLLHLLLVAESINCRLNDLKTKSMFYSILIDQIKNEDFEKSQTCLLNWIKKMIDVADPELKKEFDDWLLKLNYPEINTNKQGTS